MKPVFGLTGGIGSGKTAAADAFRALGIDVADADQAARAIMAPGGEVLSAVAERFGENILLPDGNLDRNRLRGLIFAEPGHRKWLEELTHPRIGEEILRQLRKAESPYAILESPLLLEASASQRKLCERVIVVDAPEATQEARAALRDRNDPMQIRRIMAAQIPRTERLAQADHVLNNTGTLDDLRAQVAKLHKKLLALYPS